MKKQLLIAAVAASMSSVAMADVSISGKGKVELKSTGSVATDMDITVAGKFAAGSVTTQIKNIQSNTAETAVFSDTVVATTIEGISVKAGTVKTLLGNGTSYKKSAKNLVVSTNVAGFGITGTTTAEAGAMSLHISGSVAGMDVKVQNANDSDARMVSLDGSFGGIDLAIESSDNADSYTVATTVGGASVHYTNFSSDAAKGSQDDGADFNTVGATEVTALVASMNGITVKHIETTAAGTTTDTNKVSTTRNGVAYTVSKSGSDDAVLSAKVAFKF